MAAIKTSKWIIVVLTVAAFSLVASTLAAITVNQDLTSSGTIATTPNIGVYSDAGCTSAITTITWGSIAAGASYITLTWNRQGSALTSGQSVAATLTLAVSASITGISTFSNTITISGTG
jgi:hypothetical protein